MYLILEITPSLTISKKLLHINVLVKVSAILTRFPDEKKSIEALSRRILAKVWSS